jgi:MOSC domain-containing protein YiiM
MTSPLKAMIDTLPQVGQIEWIGLRPEKRLPLQSVTEVAVEIGKGLAGDHYRGSSGNREVTLIQGEHLDGVAQILGKDNIDPSLTRRNLVVRGINLLSFANRRLQIGDVILEMTGPCEPCSRMEENLGPGGYNAMRGHGGICTRVIQSGTIRVGDEIRLAEQ